MKTVAAVIVSAAAVLLSCSGPGDKTSADSLAAVPGASSEESVSATGAATVMQVTVNGGPRAGTYEKTAAEPTCTVGYAAKGAWGNVASDIDDTEGLTGIDLIVPDPAAAARGTSDFVFTAYFDERSDEKNRLHIEPAKGAGSGTVKIEDRGQSGRVSVTGKTSDGVGIDATIDCKQMMRVG